MVGLTYVNNISFNLDLKRDRDWVSLRAGGREFQREIEAGK